MRDSETLTEDQRRYLVHIYAALREHIKDELKYNREPDFAPLKDEAFEALWDETYEGITALMFGAHAEEAARIEAEVEEARGKLAEALWRLDVGLANAEWLDQL